ncbi:PPA1309 family protein [Actinokineospora pegani]|uniref:PPA1309 family protein n=1 Tax=Actinokineospora pegani TaxID=2654637 RepID=UPI0012EA50A7
MGEDGPVTEPTTPAPDAARLAAAAREVEEYVAAGGWDQAPQLFALVPTDHLLREQPELADRLDPTAAPLTPVAQDPLEGDLGEALAAIMWPEAVAGCALAQEIVMLPPDAEAELPDSDADAMGRVAAAHPQAREARLIAAVSRDGATACVLRLRTTSPDQLDEVVEHPGLAKNLTTALLETLRP